MNLDPPAACRQGDHQAQAGYCCELSGIVPNRTVSCAALRLGNGPAASRPPVWIAMKGPLLRHLHAQKGHSYAAGLGRGYVQQAICLCVSSLRAPLGARRKPAAAISNSFFIPSRCRCRQRRETQSELTGASLLSVRPSLEVCLSVCLAGRSSILLARPGDVRDTGVVGAGGESCRLH